MVLVLILHIYRVYLTGGFKKPREFIWITGIILALTTVSFGVIGFYSFHERVRPSFRG
jgi:cytochrome b6